MMCNLGHWQHPIHNSDGLCIILNCGLKIWLSKPAHHHKKLVGLAHIVVVHITSPIDVLVVLFVYYHSVMMTTILSEIMDQDHPYAENLITPPALVTPAATDTTATFVVPLITLHIDAGSHCFPAEVSGPRTWTSL